MAFQRDFQYGLKHQTELLPKLEAFFKDKMVATKGTFAKYDYVGETTDYELKSRNNMLMTYPTTCIGVDKIQVNSERRQVFIFHFLDGTYYIPYTREIFDTFEIKEFRRFRIGVNDKKKNYLYIPVNLLQKVENSLSE
jgi:hypothetical protein